LQNDGALNFVHFWTTLYNVISDTIKDMCSHVHGTLNITYAAQYSASAVLTAIILLFLMEKVKFRPVQNRYL